MTRCGCGFELPTVNACDFADTPCVHWTGAANGPYVPNLVINPDPDNLLEERGDGLYGAFPDYILSPPKVRMGRTTDMNISSGGTAVQFTYAYKNDDGMWVSANNTRLTALTTGFYEMGGCFSLETSASGIDFTCAIRINGATTICERQIRLDTTTDGEQPSDAERPTALVIATEYPLTGGQYIDFFLSHTGSGTKRLLASEEMSPIGYLMRAA